MPFFSSISVLYMMNDDNREDKVLCYFHPKEVFVGVCPLCLNERLLILASKKGHFSHTRSQDFIHRKPPISLQKIFAFTSFLNRLEFPHWKSDNSDQDDLYSSSPEDNSFISIKFENNGVASWEKGAVSKVSEEETVSWNQTLSKETKTKSVVEHAKPLRWRKRIGHMFQLIRWKRSNKANMCHVGTKVEGVKVRKKKGWIRTVTKIRTKE